MTAAPACPRPAPATAPAPLEQRRSRRMKVFLPIEFVIDDTTIRAHVLDVSPAGSRVHTGTAPRAGGEASLRVGGGAISARVIWTEAGRCGVRFEAELTSEQVAQFLAG